MGNKTDRRVRLTDDELYRALASTRRRRLLYALLVEEQSTTERLATVLTGWNTTETGRMATPVDREQIRTDLVHRHLPLLDDSDLVAYDRDSGAVEIGELDGNVSELISRSVEAERPARS